MPIAPKPAKAAPPKRPVAADSIEHTRRDHRGKLVTPVSLRMATELDQRITKHLNLQPGRISRNTFIIQAIEEKLHRDARK